MFALILFEFLISIAYANLPPTKYSPVYNFRTQIRDVSSTECLPNDRGYTQIEQGSSILSPGNHYACNMKFKNTISLDQGLLLISKCNFTCLSSIQGIIYVKATEDNLNKQSIEIHDCFFYQSINESIHIISKLPSRQVNIVRCTFTKCNSSTAALAIYFEVTAGKIEQCSFINNLADNSPGTDIYYKYNPCDEPGKVTFINNFFKKNPLSSGNLISFDPSSSFEFIQNTISVSIGSASSIAFSWPSGVNDLSGFKFENNVLYPYATSLISNIPNELKDKFIEKEEIECPPNYIPFSPNVPVKSLCDSLYETTLSPSVDVTSNLVSIVYCIFKLNTNTKTYKGGAVYIYIDKNMPTYDEPIRVYNSDFFYNDAKYGAAFYAECYQDDLLFDFRDSYFIDNFYLNQKEIDINELKGGSVYIKTKFSSFSFQRCYFDDSLAGDGGAIYYLSDTSDSSDPTNSKNEYSLYLIDCEFHNTRAYSNGAGIFISLIGHEHSTPIHVECCNFYKCYADQRDPNTEQPENGGGIYYSASYTALTESTSDSSFNVINCCFTSCEASFTGGAIAIYIEKEEPSRPFNIDDCIFSQNTIGAIDCFENCGSGNDIHFNFNSISTKDFQNGNFLFVNNCYFEGGNPLSKKGTMVSISIDNEEPSKSIEIKECTFINNKNSPSPIYYNFISTSSSTRTPLDSVTCYALHVINSTFNSNTLDENGGAIGITLENKEPSNPIKITECTFTNNAASDSNATDEENGGAIYYIDKASSSSNNYFFSIVDSQFSNNQVSFNGGSIFIEIANHEPSNLIEISRCSFENGVAGKNGGFIYYKFNAQSLATSTLSTSHNLHIYDCEFTGTDDTLSTENGGSISILIPDKEPSKSIEISKCTFTKCKCKNSAGAISYTNNAKTTSSTDYSFNIVDCKFTGCKASYGGAIYVSNVANSKITILKCKFEQNSADLSSSSSDENNPYFGGSAIFIAALNTVVIKCKFANNFGTGVKIINKNEQLQKMILKSEQLSIKIDDCVFETDEKSKSSLLYVRGSKNEIPVEVNRCIFKGKMIKGSYHIDGESIVDSKKPLNIHIKSCQFLSGKESTLNKNKSSFLLESFEDKDSEKKLNSSYYDAKEVLIIVVGFVCIAVLSAVSINFIMKKKNDQHTSEEKNIEL